jgi:hypothetical protein
MDTTKADRQTSLAAVVAILAVAIVALVYAFSSQVGADGLRAVSDIADILGAWACVVLCVVLWRAFDKGEVLKRVWGFLGVGLAMWAVAEVIYGVYELILHLDTPSPSLADVLWVPGYIPLFIALWLRFRSLRVKLSRTQLAGLLISFAVLVGISLIFVILPYAQSQTPDPTVDAFTTTANLVLGVLYPLGDLLLALGVGLVIVILMGGQLSRSWILIALGALSIALGDSLYYSGAANGLYTADIPVNLFTAISDVSYFAGYVTIALGLYTQALLERAL